MAQVLFYSTFYFSVLHALGAPSDRFPAGRNGGRAIQNTHPVAISLLRYCINSAPFILFADCITSRTFSPLPLGARPLLGFLKPLCLIPRLASFDRLSGNADVNAETVESQRVEDS